MKNIFIIMQIILSAILTLLILIQSRGTGLSRSWGTGGGVSQTRRGLEKIIFKFTFIISALFIIISIVQLAI